MRCLDSKDGRLGVGLKDLCVRVSRVWQVLSVPAACKFMEANPSVSFEEKKAFLLEKGVPEFTIAQAACTAPDTTLVL